MSRSAAPAPPSKHDPSSSSLAPSPPQAQPSSVTSVDVHASGGIKESLLQVSSSPWSAWTMAILRTSQLSLLMEEESAHDSALDSGTVNTSGITCQAWRSDAAVLASQSAQHGVRILWVSRPLSNTLLYCSDAVEKVHHFDWRRRERFRDHVRVVGRILAPPWQEWPLPMATAALTLRSLHCRRSQRRCSRMAILGCRRAPKRRRGGGRGPGPTMTRLARQGGQDGCLICKERVFEPTREW